MLNELVICGFFDVVDVGSSFYIFRYLVILFVLLLGDIKDKEGGKEVVKDSEEDGKILFFCVFLYGSLKVEKMVVIVILEWVYMGYWLRLVWG